MQTIISLFEGVSLLLSFWLELINDFKNGLREVATYDQRFSESFASKSILSDPKIVIIELIATALMKLKNNKGFDALIIATKENFNDVFEYLLSKGADITATNSGNRRQPIHIAAKAGYLGILEEILNKGVDVNQATINKEMPLHLAVQSLYLPTVKYLIGKGANINAIDRSGNPPLDSARKLGTKRMIDYLIKQGAESADSF